MMTYCVIYIESQRRFNIYPFLQRLQHITSRSLSNAFDISYYYTWTLRMTPNTTFKGKYMTDGYLRDIILNFIIAGKDASANTLNCFFHMLWINPFIQEKISQEVLETTSGIYNFHQQIC